MTDIDQNLDVTDYQTRVQHAIAEFNIPEGLKISATVHWTGYPFLEICGRALTANKGFSYRVGKPDLQDYGDGWFTEQALAKLSDLYASGCLPFAPPDGECEHQFLHPVDLDDPFNK